MDRPRGVLLWEPFLDGLPVDGGSVSVISRSGLSSTVSTSDATASRLDALQLELGEGPRWRTFRSGVPVLVPDVRASGAHGGWPLFGDAVSTTDAQGVFSFPLVLGLLIVGVADLYSATASGDWSDDLVADAVAIASAAAGPAVLLATRSASAERSAAPSIAAELRREVHQATGVLVVQLELSPQEALLRLEAHAFSSGRPLLDVARDVLARTLDMRTILE